MFLTLETESFSLPQQTNCLALDKVSVLEWREHWRSKIVRSRLWPDLCCVSRPWPLCNTPQSTPLFICIEGVIVTLNVLKFIVLQISTHHYCVTIRNTFMSHRTQKVETLGVPNNENLEVPDPLAHPAVAPLAVSKAIHSGRSQ